MKTLTTKCPDSLFAYIVYCDSGSVFRVLAAENTEEALWARILERRADEGDPGLRFWSPPEAGSYPGIIIDSMKVVCVRPESFENKPVQPDLRSQRERQTVQAASAPMVPGGRVTVGKTAMPVATKKR